MKAHILSSTEPVQEWRFVIALCRAELSPARMVFCWDEQGIGAEPMLSRVNFCGNCIDKARSEHLAQTAKRYVYGVIKGEL